MDKIKSILSTNLTSITDILTQEDFNLFSPGEYNLRQSTLPILIFTLNFVAWIIQILLTIYAWKILITPPEDLEKAVENAIGRQRQRIKPGALDFIKQTSIFDS